MKGSRTFFFMFRGPKQDLLHLTVGAHASLPSLADLFDRRSVSWPAVPTSNRPVLHNSAACVHACHFPCSALQVNKTWLQRTLK